MNYNELIVQITNYANRNPRDEIFRASVPFFIEQAQQRIWREAQDIGFETLSLIGRFQQNNPIIPKPRNWNKTISIQVTRKDGTVAFLEPHTYETCVLMWPNINVGNEENPPLYYTDREFTVAGNANPNYFTDTLTNTPYSAWFISPTPYTADARTYPLNYQVNYYASIQNISNGVQANILTLKFPDLLFYSCMREAFSFTQENERMQVFDEMYLKALDSVNKQSLERMTDRTVQI